MKRPRRKGGSIRHSVVFARVRVIRRERERDWTANGNYKDRRRPRGKETWWKGLR